MKENLEGYAARMADLKYNDNPYGWYSHNKQWNDWADGWVRADIDLEIAMDHVK